MTAPADNASDAERKAATTMAHLLRFGAAVTATIVATLLRLVLAPLVGAAAPFATYFVAILLVAWYGGFRPAVLSILLSALAGTYFFVSPATTSPFVLATRTDRVTVFGFVVVSLAATFLLDLQWRTLSRLECEAVRRRAAEDAEREQQLWFEITLASIGDGVVATDAEGKVKFMNTVASELTGWHVAQARGLPLHDVFHIVNERTGAETENPIDRVMKEGVIVGLANHTLLISRDGRRIPVDDSGAPIKRDGRTVGAVLVFRDASARRRAEREAAYLAAIVESSDDAIVGKSIDGIIQSWNSGAERLYGYPAAEMIGHHIRELVPPDRQHEEASIFTRLGAGESVEHLETVRLRKGGVLIDVSLTISPIRDKSGQIVGASNVARDITEQQRAAENMRQTQKLESLGVLAGGIAHDFNNLLVGIVGNASVALEDISPDSPARQSIRDVVAAGKRAGELTRQMLAYSGRGHFVIDRIDLSKYVREEVRLIQAAIPRTVALHLALQESLPAIEADASQIQQLVMNLVINGAEAIPEGTTGTVTIVTRQQQLDQRHVREHVGAAIGELKPGPYVLLEVRDTGSGMDEATKATIFDPFFTTKFTGRGLGLAAVLGIVRGHFGAIEVVSAPEQGTVFRVFFPALAVVPDRQPQQHQDIRDLSGHGTILVIDDEQIVRSMVKRALEHYGYSVLLAEDGERGLELFRQAADHIQCVVLDMTMPVMSGEETLSRLRALSSDIPVILSSGFNEAEAMRRFEGKDLAGFVQKPYTAPTLAKKIKDVWKRSKP
jgi:two-component system, cell cycle sensor histidine kinase and response regulator CckA